MTTLYVDADACPVKDEIYKVAARHQLTVYVVSNAWFRIPDQTWIHRILVKDGADEADNWIVDHILPKDIFITGDILLADQCVKKGAFGLTSTGRPLNPDTIGSAVAIRNLNSLLRETGEMAGRQGSFSGKDKSTFLQNLENLIQDIKRGKI